MTEPGKERRRHPRYLTDAKIYFEVTYDIQTKVRYQVTNRDDKTAYRKYLANGKNVSAQGIGFKSFKKLNLGDLLHLEVTPPGAKDPIHMDGEVRWSETLSEEDKLNNVFDTGVRLTAVSGKSVDASIHVDEENRVIWSIVLESLFGSFRVLQQKMRDSGKNQNKNE